jgi:hypothetical protein
MANQTLSLTRVIILMPMQMCTYDRVWTAACQGI